MSNQNLVSVRASGSGVYVDGVWLTFREAVALAGDLVSAVYGSGDRPVLAGDVVDSREVFDSFPYETVVRDCDGIVYERDAYDEWYIPGGEMSDFPVLPVTVLYMPEANDD